MKKLFSAVLIVLVLCLGIVPASAIEYGCTIEPVCEAIYLEELTTGTVVYEYCAEDRVYPASTTKIMTYIVVAENVGDIDGARVEITADALADLDPESSVMGLAAHIGESFSVRDLLYGLMLPSGNDAALVLANYVSGSVDDFVALMNEKAAQLGCEGTHFTSPHGLHDTQHYSTARDMAVMAKYAMQKADFMEICNSVYYQPSGFEEPIRTTNYLIDSTGHNGDYYYPYAKGIKTGYTDQAGRCLVSTAEKDGYRYLCIALGADYSFIEDVNYAMLDTIKYYDWAFENIAVRPVYSADDVLRSIPVKYVWGNRQLDLIPESAVSTLLPKDYDASKIVTTIECEDEVEAPVAKGQVLGKLTVSYEDTAIGTTNIIASEGIERDFFNYVLTKYIVWIIVAFVVLILVIVLLVRAHARKKARRARHNSRARH